MLHKAHERSKRRQPTNFGNHLNITTQRSHRVFNFSRFCIFLIALRAPSSTTYLLHNVPHFSITWFDDEVWVLPVFVRLPPRVMANKVWMGFCCSVFLSILCIFSFLLFLLLFQHGCCHNETLRYCDNPWFLAWWKRKIKREKIPILPPSRYYKKNTRCHTIEYLVKKGTERFVTTRPKSKGGFFPSIFSNSSF